MHDLHVGPLASDMCVYRKTHTKNATPQKGQETEFNNKIAFIGRHTHLIMLINMHFVLTMKCTAWQHN